MAPLAIGMFAFANCCPRVSVPIVNRWTTSRAAKLLANQLNAAYSVGRMVPAGRRATAHRDEVAILREAVGQSVELQHTQVAGRVAALL